ncbi:DUF1761 domain-containing protein [Alkalibacillus haloalkaliphilus]|uniref:DUF1761 domain-containing protein n=1 Tax=Alkalibacillus haloalkaliphilus TaxID=94136 RepID=A0A511W1H4_9BACI|nr:DUF1761 domain-containing protein [Alkalibacillus haloalkaliphilus]GEN44611.1 hypothetical protein AHA02nite_03870 [Alkalibacillus haloalkaliphilus]
MLLAIILGVIIYMVLGMVYYSPKVLGRLWVKYLNIQEFKTPRYDVLSLATFLTVSILYFILRWSEANTALEGLYLGALVGLLVALAYAKDFVFGLGENTGSSLKVYFIAVGFHIIVLSVIGLVMGNIL